MAALVDSVCTLQTTADVEDLQPCDVLHNRPPGILHQSADCLESWYVQNDHEGVWGTPLTWHLPYPLCPYSPRES